MKKLVNGTYVPTVKDIYKIATYLYENNNYNNYLSRAVTAQPPSDDVDRMSLCIIALETMIVEVFHELCVGENGRIYVYDCHNMCRRKQLTQDLINQFFTIRTEKVEDVMKILYGEKRNENGR